MIILICMLFCICYQLFCLKRHVWDCYSKWPHFYFRTWPTLSLMAICRWTPSSNPIRARESWPICGEWRLISYRRWCSSVSRCHIHQSSMLSLRHHLPLHPFMARLMAPQFPWLQHLQPQCSWQGSRLLYPTQQFLTLLSKCPTWCHPTRVPWHSRTHQHFLRGLIFPRGLASSCSEIILKYLQM